MPTATSPASAEPIVRQLNWRGHWLMATALLHVGYGVFRHAGALRDVAGLGFFDAIAGDPARALAAWFVLFGAGLFLLGLAVAQLERLGANQALRQLGLGLLLLAITGLVLMPLSGFWLALPPALALLLRPGNAAIAGRRAATRG